MPFPVIEKTIEIHAPPSKVWRVFTDPALSRQMGGEYVSDWRPGSAFGWKGPDGKMLTSGTILEIMPEKLLKHDLSDKNNLLSVITYELIPHQEATLVAAREELQYELTEEQLQEAEEGWEIALRAVKDLAEKTEAAS
ncbi:SRPBCC domain-containing protein [Chitinophaga sp. GCM10012297]|uniref:SRPBCC domain-containing protein n=1 Tax=Chitinophaga chungangae TaxID=2821488 RepID=A0ABS3YA35_9BACT|nr:SRPBCC family protein [Chitinophaga chungangae]MBO9151545.1 SRPBCC domain-containing protein [Chitinophaga chungangae]